MTTTVLSVVRDDAEMPVHIWAPDTDDAVPAIVLVQEIFGIEDYIHDVAERLVGDGYLVAAPELYWRFAPGFVADKGPEGLQSAFETVQQLDPGLAVADVLATLDVVGALDVTTDVGVLGFCLGGTLAFAAAIEGSPSACVAYYGSGVDELLPRIDEVDCPTLFQYGRDDEYIPAAHIEAVNAAIEGRDGFVLNVERAGHAFDNHTRDDFHNADAAQAAWAKTMAFLGQHLSR